MVRARNLQRSCNNKRTRLINDDNWVPRTTEERHTVLETAYLASPDSSVLEQLKLCESTVFETNAWFKVLVLISPLLGRVPTPPGTTSSQNGLQIPALLHGRQELPHYGESPFKKSS